MHLSEKMHSTLNELFVLVLVLYKIRSLIKVFFSTIRYDLKSLENKQILTFL